jgi:hypothetical protein
MSRVMKKMFDDSDDQRPILHRTAAVASTFHSRATRWMGESA